MILKWMHELFNLTMNMIQKVCVYASSSNKIPQVFFDVAEELGKLIGHYKFELVFGGGNIGLMNTVAQAAQTHGGKVKGIIPRFIFEKELGYSSANELIVTNDMSERKNLMAQNSDAFIALPGGFGTLEEIMEQITLKQLLVHNKPIIILNVEHIYDALLNQFEVFYQNHFAKEENRSLYFVCNSAQQAIQYLIDYIPVHREAKWFSKPN
jgi:uncharacterized protein (TIGR00730 family)